MKRFAQWLGLVLLLLTGVLLFNTWRLRAIEPSVDPYLPHLDADALAARLGAAVSIATVSPTETSPGLDAFAELHALLRQQFPRVHDALTHEVASGASLLYRWSGRERCAPMVLIAHQDVVPIEPGTEADWTHAPFSGAVAEGHVWGRGTIDDKASMLGILEAVEHLLGEQFTPQCDVYLAFGHDEEVGGTQGAAVLATLLRERGVQPSFVLDEGGAITVGAIPGIEAPVAVVGVAEKGYVSVRLIARGDGGHSSMPPRRTPVGRLARAVARLEEKRPPARIAGAQREMLRRIAPHAPFGRRVILSNQWLSAPLVERSFAGAATTDAAIRTTTAPTMFSAGIRDNVLPQYAEAVVNFRVRPGDSVAGVRRHVRATIDDETIEVQVLDAFSAEPTTPAPWDDDAFAAIETALRRVSPEQPLIVAPYVTLAATDARHYAELTSRLYRLLPAKLTTDLIAVAHGTNERLPVEEYVRIVRFYVALLMG